MLFLFYGFLAFLALWSTIKDWDLRWIGLWLVAGWIISNLLFFFAPVTDRPGPYSLIEVLVASSATVAWGVHKEHFPLVGKLLIAVVGFNLASVGVTTAFALNFPPVYGQIYLFELGTNLCFAAECLLTTIAGVIHGHRAGRFTYLFHNNRENIQQHALNKSENQK